tara:strand:- start:2343 stop:2927 length:585 start_codon:yes stop_codon:yes gene_type:complete
VAFSTKDAFGGGFDFGYDNPALTDPGVFGNSGGSGISTRDAFGGGFRFAGDDILDNFGKLLTLGKAGSSAFKSPSSDSSSSTGKSSSTRTSVQGGVLNSNPYSSTYILPAQDPFRFAGGGGSAGGGGPSGFDKMLGRAGQVAGLAATAKTLFPVTFAALCDIRTKTNVAPLETTEVNDNLADIAFFVKELRECS